MPARRDVLHAHGVLGPAQGVEDGPGLVRPAGGGVRLVDLDQVLFGNAGDFGHAVQVVALVVVLQHVDDAAGVRRGSCRA